MERWKTNGRIPEYLKKDNLGEGKRGEEVRILFKLRYGNLKEDIIIYNKYWVKEYRKKYRVKYLRYYTHICTYHFTAIYFSFFFPFKS